MNNINPPAQDQPVTPQAEEWTYIEKELIKLAQQYNTLHQISMKTGEYSLPGKVKDVIKHALKSAHNSGVEEIREKLKHIRMFHHAFEDSKEKISLYEVQDVLDILTSLSPNQHKE